MLREVARRADDDEPWIGEARKERIESRDALDQLAHMKVLNMGNDQYRLITL